MKARLCLVTSLLLLAAPAFAQEPLDSTGTEPTTQMAPSPSDTGQAKEPLDQVGTEPGKQAAPAESAMPPANEPLEQAGANEDQKQQQAADQPAELVITDLTEAQDGKKLVKPWNVPVDSIAQMDVLNAKGKKIGQVDAVLQDKDGNIKGVAVGYGGFLGFGEKGAIVTLDQMKLKNGALVTEVDEDQLSKLPEWKKK
jgi:sporulation protein YlmC with PRC-barrel domain